MDKPKIHRKFSEICAVVFVFLASEGQVYCSVCFFFFPPPNILFDKEITSLLESLKFEENISAHYTTY